MCGSALGRPEIWPAPSDDCQPSCPNRGCASSSAFSTPHSALMAEMLPRLPGGHREAVLSKYGFANTFCAFCEHRKPFLYAHVPPSLVSTSACCPLQISPPCFPLKLLRAKQALSLMQTWPESRPCCKWRLGEGPSRSAVGCSVLLTENRTCCSFPAICQPLPESHLRPAPSSCCLSLSKHKGSLRVMTTEKIML